MPTAIVSTCAGSLAGYGAGLLWGSEVGAIVGTAVAVVVAGGLEKLDRAHNWSGFHQAVPVVRGQLSSDELKNIGSHGENTGIRHVAGTAEDARTMFDSQVIQSTVKEVKPGVFVGQDANGYTYTFRAISVSEPPTIDINGIAGLRKIKFI